MKKIGSLKVLISLTSIAMVTNALPYLRNTRNDGNTLPMLWPVYTRKNVNTLPLLRPVYTTKDQNTLPLLRPVYTRKDGTKVLIYSKGVKTQAFLYRMLFKSALMPNSRTKRGVLKNLYKIAIGGMENEKHRPCKMESKMRTSTGSMTPYVDRTCVSNLSQHNIPNNNYVCVNIRQKKLISNHIVDVGVGCELRCKGHDCAPFFSNMKKKRIVTS